MLYEALDPRRSTNEDVMRSDTLPTQSKSPAIKDFTIRGSAGGPLSIRASNFIKGTTAKDIKQAFSETCGVEIDDVDLIQELPTVTVELSFPRAEDAYQVLKTFDGQKADGKIISVVAIHEKASPKTHYNHVSERNAPRAEEQPGSRPRSRPRSPPRPEPETVPSPSLPEELRNGAANGQGEHMEVDEPQQQQSRNQRPERRPDQQSYRGYDNRYDRGQYRPRQGMYSDRPIHRPGPRDYYAR